MSTPDWLAASVPKSLALLHRDLAVAREEGRRRCPCPLVVAGDDAEALAQDVDDPGIDQLSDRAGQGVAQLSLDLVEGLGHLLLGDGREVEPAAGGLRPRGSRA